MKNSDFNLFDNCKCTTFTGGGQVMQANPSDDSGGCVGPQVLFVEEVHLCAHDCHR